MLRRRKAEKQRQADMKDMGRRRFLGLMAAAPVAAAMAPDLLDDLPGEVIDASDVTWSSVDLVEKAVNGLTEARLWVNGIEISDHVHSFSMLESCDQVEKTTFGDTNRTYVPGLRSTELEVDGVTVPVEGHVTVEWATDLAVPGYRVDTPFADSLPAYQEARRRAWEDIE
ncbi:MAG: hypothetical protein HKN01_01360 [Acidimicrobiia bacterium]|nr:hypothetical protein [Acidimicrobiia bacterium]